MSKETRSLKDDDHQKAIIKLIKEAAYSHGEYQVFNDWLEMAAISISNQFDPTHREEREKRYLDVINSYEKREQQLFPEMFAHLVAALQEKAETTGAEDILGLIFHELELHNKYKGQFFTPQHISDMMAKMVCGDKNQAAIEEKGFISVCEPTCGSGVMVTSMCKAMAEEGLNYCTQLVVTAVDVDLKCVHMTYLQLALYGVPAVVIHGNSLTCEEWSRWYTPVYILNGWIWRARCSITTKFCVEDEMIKCVLEPMYGVLRQAEALFRENEPTEAEPPDTHAVAATVSADITDVERVAYEQPTLAVEMAFAGAQPPQKTAAGRKRQNVSAQANADQMSLFGVLN